MQKYKCARYLANSRMLHGSKELASWDRQKMFFGDYIVYELEQWWTKAQGNVDSGLGSAAFSQVTSKVFNLLSFFSL